MKLISFLICLKEPLKALDQAHIQEHLTVLSLVEIEFISKGLDYKSNTVRDIKLVKEYKEIIGQKESKALKV